MRMQRPNNDIVDSGDLGERVGGGWGIRDYKMGTVYSAWVMGAPKISEIITEELIDLTKHHGFPQNLWT